MDEEIQQVRGVNVAIERTRGSWPWVAVCAGCGRRSPHHRTEVEAEEWASSHVHVRHEIDGAESIA